MNVTDRSVVAFTFAQFTVGCLSGGGITYLLTGSAVQALLMGFTLGLSVGLATVAAAWNDLLPVNNSS